MLRPYPSAVLVCVGLVISAFALQPVAPARSAPAHSAPYRRARVVMSAASCEGAEAVRRIRLDNRAGARSVTYRLVRRSAHGRAVTRVQVPAHTVRFRRVRAAVGYQETVRVRRGRGPVVTRAVRGDACAVLVIGDSLTRNGTDALQALQPAWYVDGYPGRPVRKLLPMLRRYLAHHPAPRTFVAALGTNEGRPGEARPAIYRRVLRLLPDSRVVLVTTYRDPEQWGAERAAVQSRVSHWMQEAARSRSDVCLARWRRTAIRHPEILKDGTHQTHPAGEQVWADLVTATVATCGV